MQQDVSSSVLPASSRKRRLIRLRPASLTGCLGGSLTSEEDKEELETLSAAAAVEELSAAVAANSSECGRTFTLKEEPKGLSFSIPDWLGPEFSQVDGAITPA